MVEKVQGMEWTDEIIAQLKELWGEGLSTAEIGRRLSITKNAVVGKAHRLGLPPRPSPIRRDGKPKAASPEKAEKPAAPAIETTPQPPASSTREVAPAPLVAQPATAPRTTDHRPHQPGRSSACSRRNHRAQGKGRRTQAGRQAEAHIPQRF
jgi:GcrA cell cycle regulator